MADVPELVDATLAAPVEPPAADTPPPAEGTGQDKINMSDSVPILAEPDQAAEARAARAVMRPSMPSRTQLGEEPPAPKKPAAKIGVEQNPYEAFLGGPQDNGFDNLTRFKLNLTSTYYRGTTPGALNLYALAQIYQSEDTPDMTPEYKAARQRAREQYEAIVADLIAYDMMPSWSGLPGKPWWEGLPQFGVAVAGSVVGSLAPESFLGWAAQGATWTARAIKAGFQQGAISAAADPVIQQLNVGAGVQKGYEWEQTVGSAAFGFGLGFGFNAAGSGFSAAGERVSDFIGQIELRSQFLELGKEDPSFNSAQHAVWALDPRNGIAPPEIARPGLPEMDVVRPQMPEAAPQAGTIKSFISDNQYTPEQVRRMVAQQTEQAEGMERAANNPDPRWPQETIDHYAQQAKSLREANAYYEAELAKQSAAAPEPRAEAAPAPPPVPERPDYSFDEAVAAEKERVAEDGGSPEEAERAAFDQEVGTNIAAAMERAGVPPERMEDVRKLYAREEGRSVEDAAYDAVDNWIAKEEQAGLAVESIDPQLKTDLDGAESPASRNTPPEFWDPPPDLRKEAERIVRGWPARQAGKRPQSLVDFVRKSGGFLKDSPEAADLLSQDIGRQPGLIRSKEAGGRGYDELAEMARDAGYDLGPDLAIGNGVNADRFMAMFYEDASGRKKHYARGATNEGYFENQRYNDEIAQHLKDLGINPKGSGMDPRQLAWILSQGAASDRRIGGPASEARGGVSGRGAAEPGQGRGTARGDAGGDGGGGVPARAEGASVGAEVGRGEVLGGPRETTGTIGTKPVSEMRFGNLESTKNWIQSRAELGIIGKITVDEMQQYVNEVARLGGDLLPILRSALSDAYDHASRARGLFTKESIDIAVQEQMVTLKQLLDQTVPAEKAAPALPASPFPPGSFAEQVYLRMPTETREEFSALAAKVGRDEASRAEINRYGDLLDEYKKPLATERTDQGEQTLMPGVAPVTDRQRIESQMAKPMQGGDKAPPAGGLFDTDARNQKDLFLRANRQTPMPGEERRPDTGVPSAPTPMSPEQQVRLRSLHQLSLELADKLGVPLRQGRLPAGATDVAGVYKQREGVIRQREIADYEVVKHEAGHAIEAKVGPALTALTNQYAPELKRLDYEQDPVKGQRVQEGFAEWMRVRLTNPLAAQRMAPGFYDAFNAFMVTTRPDILNTMGQMVMAHREYLQAPSLDVTAAVVRNTIPDPMGLQATREQMAREGIPATTTTIAQAVYQRWQDQYTHYVDRFADLERAVHDILKERYRQSGGQIQELRAAYDPSILIRSANRVGQTAMMESRFGVIPHMGTSPIGPSVTDFLNTAMGKPTWNPSAAFKFGLGRGRVVGHDPAKIEAFDQYVTARMSAVLWDRYDQGLIPNEPSPIKPGDARQTIMELEAANPGFRQAADQMQQFIDQMRQKAFDAGLWSADTLAKTREYEFYVPMKRVRETTGIGHNGGPSLDDASSIGSGVRKRMGSERDIDSPLRNVMRNLFVLEQDIRRNDIYKAMRDLSQSVPGEGGKYAEMLPAHEAKKYTAQLQEMIEQRAKEVGVDPDEVRIFVDQLLDGESGPLVGSYWRYEQAAARGEPIVFIWENGVPQPMRLMSKMAGERYGLFEVMTQAPKPVFDTWFNVLQIGATALRAGITQTPAFILRNYIRDQFQVALSQPGYIPFIGGLKGLLQEVRQDKVAIMRAYFGGEMGGALVNEVETKFQADLRDLGKQGYLVRSFTSWNGLMQAMQLTEAGTRNSIWERFYKQKLKEGLSDFEAMWEASHQANDIMAFSRYGDRMALVRKIIPFLGANIQGQDRYTWRTMLEPAFKAMTGQNISVRDKENAQRSIYAWMMAGAGGLAFGAAWAALNWDEKGYRDATPEIKGTHLVAPWSDGQIFTMPLPFELGFGFVIGQYAYAGMAEKDPRAAAQMREALTQAFMPPNPTTIPVIAPILELKSNTSFFTGRPIVPDEIKNTAHPELEYTERTSSLARHLGKQMGWSPMKIEYAVGSLFGTAGRDALSLSSLIDQDTPTQALDDAMFFRAFIRNIERTSIHTKQFWELMGAKNGKYAGHAQAYRQLVTETVRRGADPSRAADLMKDLTAPERAFVTLKEGADARGNPAFTADDRRAHPMIRAYDAVKVLGDTAKEIQTNTLVPYRAAPNDKIQLSPDQRRRLIDDIRTMAGAEMRNAFVVIGEKGYADRPIVDTKQYMENIERVSPAVAQEIRNRYATAKVYSFDAVREAWPTMQRELVQYGSQANIRGEVSQIRSAGYDFAGQRSKRPAPVRREITGTGTAPAAP